MLETAQLGCELLKAAGHIFECQPGWIDSKDEEANLARAAVIQVLSQQGWGLKRIGRRIGLNHSTVYHIKTRAIPRFTERREFRAAIDHLRALAENLHCNNAAPGVIEARNQIADAVERWGAPDIAELIRQTELKETRDEG